MLTSCSRCDWCGIWTPLPGRQIHISTAANIDNIEESPPAPQPIVLIEDKVITAPLELHLKALGAIPDALMEECLCQAPCLRQLVVETDFGFIEAHTQQLLEEDQLTGAFEAC